MSEEKERLKKATEVAFTKLKDSVDTGAPFSMTFHDVGTGR